MIRCDVPTTIFPSFSTVSTAAAVVRCSRQILSFGNRREREERIGSNFDSAFRIVTSPLRGHSICRHRDSARPFFKTGRGEFEQVSERVTRKTHRHGDSTPYLLVPSGILDSRRRSQLRLTSLSCRSSRIAC